MVEREITLESRFGGTTVGNTENGLFELSSGLDGASVRYELKKPFVTVAEMARESNWRPQGDLNPCIHRERVMS